MNAKYHKQIPFETCFSIQQCIVWTDNFTCVASLISFPVPDLRDLSDIAWFTRSVRPEILHAHFEHLELETVLGDSRISHQTFIIQAKELNGEALLL